MIEKEKRFCNIWSLSLLNSANDKSDFVMWAQFEFKKFYQAKAEKSLQFVEFVKKKMKFVNI